MPKKPRGVPAERDLLAVRIRKLEEEQHQTNIQLSALYGQGIEVQTKLDVTNLRLEGMEKLLKAIVRGINTMRDNLQVFATLAYAVNDLRDRVHALEHPDEE